VYRKLNTPDEPEVDPEDLFLMNKMDRIYTKRPFFGVKRMTWQLGQDGFPVNHKRVARLMRVMGIHAIFPKPYTSKPKEENETYPYLLSDMVIKEPNQVWGTDITYIRIHGSWAYLVALLDWYSRYVVAWELSPCLEVGFCVNTLNRALSTSQPQIHNSDKGSQFTSKEYLDILKGYPDIKISMDSRGRCMDNIFTERLWRSLKYEEVYLKDYQDLSEAKKSLDDYFHFYNWERPHQSLGNQIPAHVYYK
jgi:putative transposase